MNRTKVVALVLAVLPLLGCQKAVSGKYKETARLIDAKCERVMEHDFVSDVRVHERSDEILRAFDELKALEHSPEERRLTAALRLNYGRAMIVSMERSSVLYERLIQRDGEAASKAHDFRSETFSEFQMCRKALSKSIESGRVELDSVCEDSQQRS